MVKSCVHYIKKQTLAALNTWLKDGEAFIPSIAVGIEMFTVKERGWPLLWTVEIYGQEAGGVGGDGWKITKETSRVGWFLQTKITGFL